MNDINTFIPYSEELLKRDKLREIKRVLCGIVILVASTYAISYVAAIVASIIYLITGVEHGEVYILDKILEMFIYTCNLLIPAVVYMLIARLSPSRCFYPRIDSDKAERVTPLSVIRYFTVAFAFSCSFSYIVSLFALTLGIDSSAFDMPTASNGAELIFDIVSVAVLPALFEELFFRGILLAVLLPYGSSFAIVTSAVVFASVHGSIDQIAYAFVSGLFFALVAVKTGSLTTGIAMHFINNVFACLADYFAEKNASLELVFAGITLLIIIFGIINAAYLIGKGRLDPSPEGETGILSVSETFSSLRSAVPMLYGIFVLINTVVSYFVKG